MRGSFLRTSQSVPAPLPPRVKSTFFRWAAFKSQEGWGGGGGGGGVGGGGGGVNVAKSGIWGGQTIAGHD